MTTSIPKQLRRIINLRTRGQRPIQFDWLALREHYKRRIDECAVNGVIGIDWDKMDCDHARWGGHSHIRATVMHFIAWENDFYDGAEGPQSRFITEPEPTTGKTWERDLALEAFENGHPHCIHY